MKANSLIKTAAMLLMLISGSSLQAIKITIPEQYEEQVEAIKKADKARVQRQLESLEGGEAVNESQGDGMQFSSEQGSNGQGAVGNATDETINASEPLVQSIAEASETAGSFEENLPEGQGLVSGQIVDKDTGQPISGVAILIDGTEIGTITDEEGRYTLGPAPAGEYSINFFKSGYLEANVTEFAVAAGEVSVFPFALPPRPTETSDDVLVLDSFTVTAEEANELMALIDMKQVSVGQIDFLSSEDFAKFAGSSVADLVSKISGVNLVEGQFAVVRGLGDRYNSTLVNGLPVPSSDPVRQGVQLDLFPNSIVQNIIVKKSFVPSLPSNTSGASFDISTKDYPDEFSGHVKVGVASNSMATDEILYNPNVIFHGVPNGESLTVDSLLGREDRSSSGGAVAADLDSSVGDNFGLTGRNYEVAFGDTFELPGKSKLGFVSAIKYSSSVKTEKGVLQNRFGIPSKQGFPFPGFESTPGSILVGELEASGLRYDYIKSQQEESSNFLLGAGWDIKGDQTQLIDFTYLRTRNTLSTATRRDNGLLPAGFTQADHPSFQRVPIDRGYPLGIDTRDLKMGAGIVGRGEGDEVTFGQDLLSVETRTLEIKQVSGEHRFDVGKEDEFTINWGLSRDKAISEVGRPGGGFVGGESSLLYLRNATGTTVNRVGSKLTAEPLVPDGYIYGGDNVLADGFVEDVLRRTARTISDENESQRLDVSYPVLENLNVGLGYYGKIRNRSVVQDDKLISIKNDSQVTGATLSEYVANVFNLDDSQIIDEDLSSFANVEQEFNDRYLSLDYTFLERVNVTFGARVSKVEMLAEGQSDLVPGFGLTGDQTSLTEQILPGFPTSGPNAVRNRDLLGFGSDSDPVVNGRINEDYVLPAILLKYDLTDRISLRADYSETIALPSARELSPVFTVDPQTGDRVVGNPTLKVSEVENFALGVSYNHENGFRTSMSFFKKEITQPIEQIGLTHPGLGLSVQSYFNNDKDATVEGVEFEWFLPLTALPFIDLSNTPILSNLEIGGNMAFIDARVGFAEATKTSYANPVTGESIFGDGDGNVFFPDERRLYDQPEYTANVFVTYNLEDLGTRATLSFYTQSDVLTTVGSGSDLSVDQYTDAYYQLDFKIVQQFKDNWELSFTAENITNTERALIYSPDLLSEKTDRLRYKVGRSYSLSLKYSF
ncbi:hypothetical protein DDZ13_10750 [Coraliomargarita sinensis]|uniref:TonB-dependent receptor n=1 Tax=Coraliomargarita sinensis TaxID=2174842 RepID=A0A317ZHQ1_9BACT|nr:TonB-dependent receptor [Coraliomargarita sinensis]PXA03763.1 hypothetical protein DDZ13_10750 [Coraliomargarita sinensis]